MCDFDILPKTLDMEFLVISGVFGKILKSHKAVGKILKSHKILTIGVYYSEV